MDLLEQLWEDYVDYWRRTAGVQNKQRELHLERLRPPHKTPQRLAALRDMALFAAEHDADPRLWLYTLFESRQWLHAPKFERLQPQAHVARYHRPRRLTFYHRKLDDERRVRRRARGERGYDANVDISTSVEGVKGQLVRCGAAQACMDRMLDDTLGFHPHSAVCAACPLADPCAQALNAAVDVDLVAVRRGDLDVEAARQQQQHNRTQKIYGNVEDFIRARSH